MDADMRWFGHAARIVQRVATTHAMVAIPPTPLDTPHTIVSLYPYARIRCGTIRRRFALLVEAWNAQANDYLPHTAYRARCALPKPQRMMIMQAIAKEF